MGTNASKSDRNRAKRTTVLVFLALAAVMTFLSTVTSVVGSAAFKLPDVMTKLDLAGVPNTNNTLPRLAGAVRTTMQSTARAAISKISGTDALTNVVYSDPAPVWWVNATACAGCRLGAGVLSILALVPLLLVALLVYYIGLRADLPLGTFPTDIPMAALWVAIFAAFISIGINFGTALPPLDDALNLSFDPTLFQEPAMIGIGLTNGLVGAVSIILTIIALALAGKKSKTRTSTASEGMGIEMIGMKS